jgi:hypothetical protein
MAANRLQPGSFGCAISPSGNVTVKLPFRHAFGMKLPAQKMPVGTIQKT